MSDFNEVFANAVIQYSRSCTVLNSTYTKLLGPIPDDEKSLDEYYKEKRKLLHDIAKRAAHY